MELRRPEWRSPLQWCDQFCEELVPPLEATARMPPGGTPVTLRNLAGGAMDAAPTVVDLPAWHPRTPDR